MLSLDWDRRRRVTPAGSKSQEAWPGVEPAGAKPLARAAVERREASASRRTRAAPPPPSSSASRARTKVGARSVVGCVFRRSASLLFWRGSCNSLKSLGRQRAARRRSAAMSKSKENLSPQEWQARDDAAFPTTPALPRKFAWPRKRHRTPTASPTRRTAIRLVRSASANPKSQQTRAQTRVCLQSAGRFSPLKIRTT